MIQIKEITIRNYRSIKEVQLRMKNFLTLVGHNNAGKSNCLKAIRSVFVNTIFRFFVKTGIV